MKSDISTPSPGSLLERLSQHAPKSFLKDGSYRLPIAQIEMPYYQARRKTRNKRIQVIYGGKQQVVEDAAALLFQEAGFTVLRGEETDTFMSLFLVEREWLGEGTSPYGDTFMNWIEANGHSKEEATWQRSRQRVLTKEYLQGDSSVLEELITGAFSLARKYYLPSSAPKEKSAGEIEGEMLFGPEEVTKETKAFRKAKKLFLDTMEGFFGKCLEKAEARRLISAYAHSALRRGAADLFVFNANEKIWFFAEVKSASDTLSPQQYAWFELIHKNIGEHAMLLRIMPSNLPTHL